MIVRRSKLANFGFYFFVLFVFLFSGSQVRAQSQSDAIAVRVLPNTNNDSIDVWYKKQGYQGSPQSLLVDGYEAIRDGRTVFVNAANLDLENKKIYTNIYLISYNQDSESQTLDVLGQLISHWKFNNNISTSGSCSISNKYCESDSDCVSGYICLAADKLNDPSALNRGKCVLEKEQGCVLDSDCPANLFCDSLKAKVIRDTKRLGYINQIRSVLGEFKANNNFYPTLQTGTYLSGSTISTWPSWRGNFLEELKLGQSLIDPINVLGYCDGYDPYTCWNEDKKKFINPDLTLPYGSYSFIYKTVNNGIDYDICSVFEIKKLGYDTISNRFSQEACLDSLPYSGHIVVNSAPKLLDYSIESREGKELNGYIKATDSEGDLIYWNLVSASSDVWINGDWQSGNFLAPILKDTGEINQRQIYHPRAGRSGSYNMLLTLSDNRGAVSENNIIIKINKLVAPVIEAADVDYFVDPINKFKYSFYLEGANSAPSFTIKPVHVADEKYLKLIDSERLSVGLNRVRVNLSYLPPTSIQVPENILIPFKIEAFADGLSSSKEIMFNLKVEKPNLNFSCSDSVRLGYESSNFNCLLGKTKSGNLDINYFASGADGLSIVSSSPDLLGVSDVYLKSIDINSVGIKNIMVKAINNYGAYTEKSFSLKINNFCGDGVLQKPNTEGRGGPNDDGNEQCDAKAGTTDKVSTSSDIQYACNSGLNTIDVVGCVFKSADNGGGFCGDGLCQFKIDGGLMMENCSNCQQDCGQCLDK